MGVMFNTTGVCKTRQLFQTYKMCGETWLKLFFQYF